MRACCYWSEKRGEKESCCFPPVRPYDSCGVEVWICSRGDSPSHGAACARRQICGVISMCGLFSLKKGLVQINSSNTLKPSLCVFFFFLHKKKFHINVLFHPRSSDNTWLSAYLAVKTDDLCTVFTLEFMCHCDKAGRPVFMSACFMSVYWDHRLSDCLLEDTNNIPWECRVPPVPSPIPYLQAFP